MHMYKIVVNLLEIGEIFDQYLQKSNSMYKHGDIHPLKKMLDEVIKMVLQTKCNDEEILDISTDALIMSKMCIKVLHTPYDEHINNKITDIEVFLEEIKEKLKK